MDLFSIASVVSIFSIPIVTYILFFKKEVRSSYSIPSWYFLFKKIAAVRPVQKYLGLQLERFNYQTLKGVQEIPRKLTSGKDEDEHVIAGADNKGNTVFIKFSTRLNKFAEISVQLKLANGKLYRLPNEPQVLLCSLQKREWKAKGLSITDLDTCKIYRITYNGFMKSDERVDHLKFNFTWTSANEPLFSGNVHQSLLTEAIARESWTDGNWLKFLGDRQGYTQFGVLHGEISSPMLEETLRIRTPVVRTRNFGTADRYSTHRELNIFAVSDIGTMINVGARSLPNGSTLLRFGQVSYANSVQSAIQKHDLSLEHTAEDGEIPSNITINLTTQESSIRCVFHIKQDYQTELYSDEKHGWVLKIVEAECDVNDERGYGLLRFWYRRNGIGTQLPAPLLKPIKTAKNANRFVIPLNDEDCHCLALTGGKGNSLGLLSSIKTDNFTVPEGFVVAVAAFRRQVEHNFKLKKSIEDINIAAIGGDMKNLTEACKQGTDLFKKEEIHEDVAEDILHNLKKLSAEIKATSEETSARWAVRSSGVDEDSDDLSAAGQNETFLGCKSEEDVLKAVAACWGSLYAFQSVQYRRQHGLPIKADIAVVIQRMVASDVAGVLFTCDPNDGNPGKMLITANYGLGESVVSGQADPDSITLKRNIDNRISLGNIHIGTKRTKVVMNEKDTDSVDTEASLSHKVSISRDQALQLGRIALELEEKFGNPRDIEWAFCKDHLYILQSRPVTTLNAWTDYELEHQLDDSMVGDECILTTGNVKEVLPGALTSLTISCTRILNTAIQKMLYGKQNDFLNQCLPCYCNHIFINFVSVILAVPKDKPDKTSISFDLTLVGQPVTTEEMLKIAIRKNGRPSFWKIVRVLYDTLLAVLDKSKAAERTEKLAKSELGVRTGMSLMELYNAVDDLVDVSEILGGNHQITSRASSIFQMIGMLIVLGDSEDYTPDHYHDLALILSSGTDVVSAEVPSMIETIAASVRSSGKSTDFVTVAPEKGADWLKKECSEAYQKYEEFMEKHGHRSFREFELMELPWSKSPDAIILMIQMNSRNESVTKKQEAMTVDETIEQMKTPLDGIIKRQVLKFFMRQSRKSVAAREKSKCELVRLFNKIRDGFRLLGQRLVEDGFLPTADLIFHLTRTEIFRLIKTRDPGLVTKAMRRQRLYPKWETFSFPVMINGFPTPEVDKEMIVEFPDGSPVLNGTPVSNGEVIARCCVINSLDEINQLETGDILITKTTDIGWSPYFPMLSGVVTELGGLISHGAVVAREYGLPCLIGVIGATHCFKTGQVVLLSGRTATLRLVQTNK